LVCYFDGAVKNVPSPSSPGLRGVLHRVALEETALFIAWSEAAAASARRIYPPCAERLLVQHPGIDLSSWPHAAAHTNVGPLRLLFVGADVERKGLDTLLDAFEDELAPACTLDVVTPGAHLDPRLRSRMARMSGVTLHDDLRPGSDRLRALYRASGCLVLPTRAEGSPWVILEAMATGLPVVTTACGGVPEMVLQERTGLLVPPDQPSALAAAVRRLMDARLRRRLGTAARKHVERRFDARRNVPALLAAIETLVETRQPASDLPRTSTQA
jgi:glycosyltransferase involved in cell wall biosynthesis